MKKALKIAKLELSIMFFSPIAWLVLIIFFIQTGMTFVEILYKYETSQQLERPLQVLTKVLFAGEEGILAIVQKYLYLYIPLLTMGLMSRETSSGSIKLLYSSPVTIKEIIFGKYLAIMVYNLLLAGLLACFIIVGMVSIQSLDIPFVLGGILGVYLLMCAYAAIGLFMSSLTNYQVVAAISTLAVLALLSFIGNVGQAYDFFRELTYWLSIRGRADYFVNGLIATKDIIYFVLVIGLFLMLSILKLSNERKTKSSAIKVVEYVSLITTMMVLGYITSMPTINQYYDTTRFKDRTLTKTSQDIIKKLKHNIHIVSYNNLLHYTASYGEPTNRIEDLQHFEMYRRFIPEMTMDYVHYYDSVPGVDTTKTLLELGRKAANVRHIDFEDVLSPKQIQEHIDLKPEGKRFVRFIHYGDHTIPLRMFDDFLRYPNETDITSTLKRLEQKQGIVGVLTGHGERDVYKNGDDSYKFITKGVNIRGSLINSGFDVVDINLNTSDNLDTTMDVLIISDPNTAYTDDELVKVKQYIQDGGNLLIAGDPGKQPLLNPILKDLGLSFMEGTLLQESKNFQLDLVQGLVTNQQTIPEFKMQNGSVLVGLKAMPITYKDSSDFKITPLVVTDKTNTWQRLEPYDLNTQKIVFDSLKNTKVAVPMAVALTKKLSTGKEQKILVVGDADFMSNAQISRKTPNNINTSFALRAFKWFSDGEYPVSIHRPKSIDNRILLDRGNIEWLKVILLAIVPLLIAVTGATILLRRRRN